MNKNNINQSTTINRREKNKSQGATTNRDNYKSIPNGEKNRPTVTGIFTAHAKGFGFVTAEGFDQDIYISEIHINGAFHQDVVEVELLNYAPDIDRQQNSRSMTDSDKPQVSRNIIGSDNRQVSRNASGSDRQRISHNAPSGGKRQEGRIVRILERGTKRLVCTFQESKNYGFGVPDEKRFSKDIFIANGRSMGAQNGQKVVVEITDYGDGSQTFDIQRGQRNQDSQNRHRSTNSPRNPEGRVVEILGFPDDPGTDILSIVRSLNLPEEFPERVLNRAERVTKPVSEADMAGRMDLRSVQMVTIDGEDAKDLDDAVSLTMDGENYVLGVHIADVANYVQENSALDKEALERGTSVYLADRVIPMLPRVLSNGICSLNQGEDRLAMSCIMTINHKGEVIDHVITESVICVNRRMNYTEVRRILDSAAADYTNVDTTGINVVTNFSTTVSSALADSTVGDFAEYDKDLICMLRRMGELAALLRRRRMSRGSIDFDLPETKVLLDTNGHAIDIRPYERNAATDLIEDFMLIANETVADSTVGDFAEYDKDLICMLRRMGELAALLRRRRMSRGSIDFDLPETKVLLDTNGHAIDIRPYERNAATDLIEDFMLIANETVAEEYYWRQIPFVYRTHANPDPEKIRALAAFVSNFGYTIHMGSDEFHPMELQKLIDRLWGSDEDALISRLTLRSMRQAQYGTECIGHFGLAAQYYCHFTSPIRRYPDLQIHRIIKDCLRGRMNDAKIAHYEEILPGVATQASQTERRAKEAERETVRMKKAEYMEQFIGEEFDGVISGVTEWGFFVELANTVEGLVRVTELDDFYEFNRDSYELVGQRSGQRYKLGQRIRVKVAAADKETRTVDFIPVE